MSKELTEGTQKLTIKDWAEEDKPREKMLLKGWSALSDAELIAILIGTGTGNQTAVDVAKSVMKAAESSIDKLAKFSVKEMQKVKGIGQAKAITIGAAMELGRRRISEDREELKQIRTSSDGYMMLKPYLHDLSVEQFFIIILNKANYKIKIVQVGIGGVGSVIADPRVIFKIALENNAANLILAHNHPSGNINPSKADLDLTKNLIAGGQTLDIPILDHLIYTNNGFLSFADEGIINRLNNELAKK
jgi:DNA repair protein RadC